MVPFRITAKKILQLLINSEYHYFELCLFENNVPSVILKCE